MSERIMTAGIVAAIEHMQKSPAEILSEDAEKKAKIEKDDISKQLTHSTWIQNKQTQEFIDALESRITDLNESLSSLATSLDESADRLTRIYLIQRSTLEGVIQYARTNDKDKL